MLDEVSFIKEPDFPERMVDVRASGAVGDGSTSNTAAFRRAIDDCRQSGGGTVVIPAGTWLTGPIHLRSNVRLHLEMGALLRFNTNVADYLPVVFTRWEGIECYNYSPLIYARDCTNIALTGDGEIDGQGTAWWHWKKLQQAAAKQLYDAEHNGVEVERRIYGTEEAALRPPLLQAIGCRDVLIEGLTFRNGPMWTIHPVYCENVLIRRVTVETNGPNTDGINPDSCRHVLIEDSTFSTGDDCIAIGSGMNEDGWRVGRPSEHILIRNCRMIEGHGAVSIGSGMSGGVRDVHVTDCTFSGCDQGIRLKSIRGRGGIVEHITFENIRMSGIRQQAITLNMFYGSSTAPSQSDAAPVFQDIKIRNVTCERAATGLDIRGLPEQPIRGVRLEDVQLNAVKDLYCEDVEDLTFRDVQCSVRPEAQGPRLEA